MATKTAKKNELPKIAKKWYDFKIDPKTLRPIQFSWDLVAERKVVTIYDGMNKNKEEVINARLRNNLDSYYFVLDKANKRIFAYPIQLVGHSTRTGCPDAHYEPINSNSFYMWDENKQLWEVPKREYQKCTGYNYAERQYTYETIKAEPRKISRLSTYYYKVQCQLPSHIRSLFSELFGKDFIYQNKLITDNEIRENYWYWHSWLTTKGRKYSDKTIKSTDELMQKFSAEQRMYDSPASARIYEVYVTLESINGINALCYFSKGKETYRQIFNQKTGKMENFIWKNDKWQKTGKLSDYQCINAFSIEQSYQDSNEYDYKFLNEALEHYKSDTSHRGYWYSPHKNIYDFTINYISKPVIHQLLQIQNKQSRTETYRNKGAIANMYGKIPNRGKTMFAKLGINKYQFDNPSAIVYVKWLLDKINISDMDKQTWDKCTAAFQDEKPGTYYDNDIISFLKSKGEFSIDRWIKICTLDRIHRAPSNIYYGGYRDSGIKQLYKDYYMSLSSLSEFGIDISAYPLLFNDKQQLQRYHDEASKAVSSIRNRAQDEKFSMLYTKRLKMLENDGEYLIDMPKCSADLTEEGSKLHHCVGGYVNSVANGNTAIYFLRQASHPETPWLTVEVRNKQCQQIHGSCNAWMGSKDEYFNAVPFLVWWFEKHDIEYSENLLTNMATGYCQASSRRAMPTQAIEQYKALRKLKKSS